MPWTAPLRGVCSPGCPWITESSSSSPGDGGLAPSMNRQRGTKQPARKQYAYTRGCRVQRGLASYSLHPRAGRPRVVGGVRRGGAGRPLPLARGKRASLPPGATGIPSCELRSTAEGCFSGLFRALPALPFSIRTVQYKAEAERVA